MSLSPKQLLSIQEATKRLNIWVGAVRSGKTYSSIFKLIMAMRSGVPGDVMIVGVNRDSIQRNVLNHLYQQLGYNPPGLKTTQDKLYGRNVYFVGAHDESSVRRIQGSTLSYAYLDEITCIPEPFWRMLLSRLSVKGAQLFGTCNPDSPSHWFKKQYLDRSEELDLISWHFLLEDNPSLDEKYKENLKKEYGSGHWYRRFILGEWALATGLIWDGFDTDNIYSNDFPSPNFYVVGLDYGTSNATAAVLLAISPKQWPQIRVVEEYYYDSVKSGRAKTDAQLVDDIYDWIQYKSVQAIYVDPAAASLKAEMRQRGLPVVDAKNDVLPGIRVVAKFIAHKNLLVHSGCKTLIDAIQSYIWDPKAIDRGEDKPLKKFEHICDALKYSVYSLYPQGQIDGIDNDITAAQARKQIYGDNESLWGDSPLMQGGGYV